MFTPDALLPLEVVVDDQNELELRDVCYTFFTTHEVDNGFAPPSARSQGFFSQACKYLRFCIN